MPETIAVVGDLHFQPKCENASIRSHVVEGQKAFLSRMVLDLKARGVKTVVFTGDIFTNHQYMSVDWLNYAVDFFQTEMADFDVHIISGNHDLMFEDRDDRTSLKPLTLIPNVHVYTESVGKLKVDDKTWYFVPCLFLPRRPSSPHGSPRLAESTTRT